jgi:putative transcriptional regulator
MAAGIILNRPASKLSPHLSTLFGSGNTLREVYLGGPHSGPVVAIHQQEAHSEYSPVQNVHFAAHIDNLKAVTRSAPRNLKIVVGQAQWPGGELDRQFETGAWLPLPLSEDLIFGDPEMLWPLAMRKVGNRFVASITGASVLPPSSLLN